MAEDDWTPEECDYIDIVSMSETKCQCMDCLFRIWAKKKNFKSDWP